MLLITGASGFVGSHLMAEVSKSSSTTPIFLRSIFPIYHTHQVAGGISVNLAHKSEVEALFAGQAISAVIHLAAEARLADCETNPDEAYKSNVLATSNLLSACQATLPYFLYVSTDMVFSGNRGTYTEEDIPEPISVYGRTKLEAEKLVQDYPGAWCVVRPSLIYGTEVNGRKSSLTWTLETIRSGNGRFFSDEIRTPVWINDLVALLIKLCATQHQGLVHAGGPERLSRLDFAYCAADIYGLQRAQIKADELSGNPIHKSRPRDLSLISETAHRLIAFTDVKTALKVIRGKVICGDAAP